MNRFILVFLALAGVTLACGQIEKIPPPQPTAIPTQEPAATLPMNASPVVQPAWETPTIPTPTATLTRTATATASPSPTPLAVFDDHKLGTVEKDIPYCTVNGVQLLMDIYYPAKGAAQGLFPVVLFVHGGGWIGGDKKEAQFLSGMTQPGAGGFMIFSINYRLAPEHKFPAQIEDVRCAMRALRTNAREYNLDPARIAVMGSSAGGHLVALLGTMDEPAGSPEDEFPGQPTRPQAVVDLFGPADLTAGFTDPWMISLESSVFGAASQSDPVLAQASPVNYVSKDDPPFLIIQGEKDSAVPASQSIELYDRLEKAGASAKLVLVKNAEHSFEEAGGPISPTFAVIWQIMDTFLIEKMK